MTPAVEEAFIQVMEQVTAVYQRGESLAPEIEAELALMMDQMTAMIAERQAPIEEPTTIASSDNNLPVGTTQEEEDAAKLLWIVSGGDPEAFVQYLYQYPDPALDELKSNHERLQQTINYFTSVLPADAMHGPPADGIARADLNSSNIFGFKYDDKSKKLIVKFQGTEGYGEGPVYSYDGVPPMIANLFMKGAAAAKTTGRNRWSSWFRGKNPSLGASFFNYIRQAGFPYQRIS